MLKIRKHQCPGCLKFFRYGINLSTHVCTRESLVCNDCNASFSKESELRKHAIKYHSVQKHIVVDNKQREEEGHKQCRKCSRIVRHVHNMNLRQHAQSHIESARRFNCSEAGCDYSSWYRQAMQQHMGSSDHTHATIIDNDSPKLQLQISQMVLQCFGEDNKPKKNPTTKRRLIPCNKCSVPVTDIPAYRKQHAKVHITDVGQFGCSEPGCGYNTWWRCKMQNHMQQHANPTIIDRQGPELQQRVADMVIECFDDCRSPEVRDELVVRKKQKPRKKSKTDGSVLSKSSVSRCATAGSSDSNTRPIDNDIEMTHGSEPYFATSHGALVEGETAYETCERIDRKMDALQQRLKWLKNLVGNK